MVRLVYSNRAEELLAELAERVRAQQMRNGALAPVRIVAPSGHVEGYLRLGIAREQGIGANLEFSRLTGLAAEVIQAASGARLADAEAIEAMALRVLLDDVALAHDDLAPVQAYLRGGGDATDPMDVRRVQLASRIGRLFEEYSYSRSDMLAAWRRGGGGAHELRPPLADRSAQVEAWQRRMWLAMFGEGGFAKRRPPGSLPLVTLDEAVAVLQPEAAALPRALHVFGFAHVARGFLELIERVARATDVIVYALSPCEGFWEDPDAADPPPLHLWGRPGREQVRALNAIAGFDHDDRFVDPLDASTGAHSLLHRLQSDVLRREPARDSPDRRLHLDGDGSVLVLEHASVRRELEAVASEIWRLVEDDDSLRFDEIALLVPEVDAATYAAQMPAVFHEAHDLPYQLNLSASVARGRNVIEAVELLLALPLGRFTRQELLRFLVHPAVLATMDEVDPVRWASWCDALGVVHGADRSDHAETYIERDVYNWDQGLRRLALGVFMCGDASGDGRPFEAGDEAYVPFEVAGAELDDAAAFGLLVRSLVADVRFIRDAELSTREWASLLCKLVEAYVAPGGPAEEEHLARCLRRLHSLGEVDLGETPVRYRVACELARERIASLGTGQAGEGVVVSTLAALRPVPFRAIFACGMGEGQFPSPEAEDPLDLRWARRREGDVTERERDKYAFLELLLGVRDRLYLSHVSREPLTGEELASSSVVAELLHVLERGYVTARSALRRHHPLRRWSPAYFPELFALADRVSANLGTMRIAEARAEARTFALRLALDRTGQGLAPDEILARAGSDPLWKRLADHLGLIHLLEPAPLAEGRLAVPVHALVKFLEFPLQGWARFRVGLDEFEDDDPTAREDEPFETDVRREVVFLRDVLLESVARRCSLEQAYDDAVRSRELRGAGPSGLFARGEREPHLVTLTSWRDQLEACGEPVGALEVARFGRAGEHTRAGKIFDAFGLDVDVVDATGVAHVRRVEIAGRTLPLGAGAASSITLIKRPKQKWDGLWVEAERDRAVLRGFLDHALLSAAGVAADVPHASLIVVATPSGAESERVTFQPLSRDEASVWLRGLVRELLQGPHAYFLPCEALFVHARHDPGGPVGPWLEKARAVLGDAEGALTLRSAYGPVPRPQDYPAPDEERARAMIASRLGTFFRKLERRP
jgi:exodeoxyribonuclease V gamma subunit